MPTLTERFNAMKKDKILLMLIFGVIVVYGALLIPGVSTFLLNNYIWIVLIILFIIFATKTDVLLKLAEYERAVIFTFGRVTRVGGPGWTIVLPIIEEYKKVDLRIQTIDVPPQDVITKGNIELKVDSVFYIKVKKDNASVIKAVTEIEDYRKASLFYVIASLRAIIGGMTLHEVIQNVGSINRRLTDRLEKITDEWGIDVRTAEIKDLTLPENIQDSMHNLRISEQEKLARLQKAKAHEGEIAAVKNATKDLSSNALAFYYIKALEEMSKGESTKFIFPLEFTSMIQNLAGKMSDTQKEKLLTAIATTTKN